MCRGCVVFWEENLEMYVFGLLDDGQRVVWHD